jgi:hypothetical protein
VIDNFLTEEFVQIIVEIIPGAIFPDENYTVREKF